MRWLALAVLVACGKPAEKPRSTTTLAITVTDQGKPVGARVLLFDQAGQAVHIGAIDLYGKRQGAAACSIAPSVIGSWDGLILADGTAEVPIGLDACVPTPAIKYGRYHVWAWRGIEYEKWEGDVDLSANRGKVALNIALERAWVPHGTLAADMHVHAHASNDSTMPNPQRVVAQVAAGIQVVVLTDHNSNGDLDADIHALGLDEKIASIAGNELTSNAQHVNVYPVPYDRNAPRGGAPTGVENASAEHLFKLGHEMKTNPIVQVNHPRFRVNSLYDTHGWNGLTWPPPFPTNFDAVEVIAGYSAFNVPGDRRIDDGIRDLFTFMDHGHVIAGVANSDTHDLNWVLDGTARTYVYVDDAKLSPFDEAGFIASMRAHRAVATPGPWLDVQIGGVGPGGMISAKGKVSVDITLSQAKWVKCEQIRITIGGPKLVQTIEVPAGARTHHWTGTIDVGTTDTWIAVTADGDTAMPLEFTGTYQKDKWGRAGVTPFALASPVLVDVDGDGRWKRGDADIPLR